MATPFEEEQEQEIPKPPLADEESPEIPFEEPPKEEGEEEEERQTRQDKKRERGELRRVAEEARAEAAAARAELQAMQQRIQQYPPTPPQPQKDPRDQEVDAAYAQVESVQQHYAARAADQKNPMTVQEQQEFNKKWREVNDAYIDARAKKNAPQQVDPEQTMMAARYPDILANENHRAWATGKWYQKLGEGWGQKLQSGEKSKWELWDEVAEETRKHFRLGSHRTQQRTPAERAAYTSGPRGGGPAGPAKPTGIKMQKEFRILADQMYPDEPDPKKRYERWARGPGKRMLEGKQSK